MMANSVVTFTIIIILNVILCESYTYNLFNSTNDFILGNLTENSVLLENYYLNTTDELTSRYFHFIGKEITRIEAFDKNQNGTGGFVSNYGLGIGHNELVLQFTSRGYGIEFNISIYGIGSPNDFIIGELSPNSILLYSHHISAPGTPNMTAVANLTYDSGLGLIRKIMAFDQNNQSTGGYVSGLVGGINDVFVTLYFSSTLPGGSIEFSIEIYGEETTDFQIGKLNDMDGAIMIYTHHVYIPAIPDEYAYGWLEFDTNNEFNITMIEGTNSRPTIGAILELLLGSIGDTNSYMSLRSTHIGVGISMWVNYFATSLIGSNHFRIGHLTNECRIIFWEMVRIPANPYDIVNATVSYNGTIPITMVQGTDLHNNNVGGRLININNVIGNTFLELFIQSSDVNRTIEFNIHVYGF